MNIITLGRGFIADHLPYEVNPYKIALDDRDVAAALSRGAPDVIINCIGKTGRPNVDWCETHQAETYISNVVLPLMIADWCERHSVRMIHIGSGCIYFGESPNIHYTQADGSLIPEGVDLFFGTTIRYPTIKIDDGWKETDFANPQSYYSKTKYACDLALSQMPHVTTLRIRMPVSDRNVPRNLINKLKGYSQLIDIPNSMTFMNDFVRCVKWFVEEGPTGIYHVANPSTLSAAQVMREYQKYTPDHTFITITEAQLDALTTAKRSNCILNTDKLRKAGFTMTPAADALQACMRNYFKK